MIDIAKKVGRPVKYESVEELEKITIEYFESCLDAEKKFWLNPPTMTGLAMALGLSRQGLIEYKNKDQFSDTIKKAKQIVEEYTEAGLHRGKNVAGVIFSLKNNFDLWEDRTKVDNTLSTHESLLKKLAKEEKNG